MAPSLDSTTCNTAPTRPVESPVNVRIVALGVAEAGIEALEPLFRALPPCPHTAFVVVPNDVAIDTPGFQTRLSQHTGRAVRVAQPGMRVEPGQVYLVSAAAPMALRAGRLELAPVAAAGPSGPIDLFFSSLACEQGAKGIGVVLRDVAPDGRAGAHALEAAGGWVLMQDAGDGEPGSACRLVDVEMLALELSALLLPDAQSRGPGGLPSPTPDDPQHLAQAVELLGRATQIDFSDYKPAMLLRRLHQRMLATGATTLQAYRQCLHDSPTEAELLRAELLIPVTSFFRDAEAFAALRESVVKPLLLSRAGPDAKPLRVWVTAVATGEEAYSVALLIDEVARELGLAPEYTIFATDLEPTWLASARAGRFTSGVIDSLPAQYRGRFVSEGDTMRVDSRLRERIVFSRHDLLSDPPFSQIDLVCCRNLLIYLRPSAQARVVGRLLQSLRVGGAMFLGSSESLPAGIGALDAIDLQQRLFRLVQPPPPLPMPQRFGTATVPRLRSVAATPTALVDAAWQALLAGYAEAAMVINANRELVQVIGDTRRWLRPAVGGGTADVLQRVAEPLAPVLQTLIDRAAREGCVQVSGPIAIAGDGALREVRLRLLPIQAGIAAGCQVVAVEALAAPGAAPAPDSPATGALAGELVELRARLQSTIRDLGASNEALVAANEQLRAVNNSLQDRNEEFQSVNEELHSVNVELQSRIEQLHAANDELESLTQAGRVAMVFVDAGLAVLRFTPEAAPLFRLRGSDIGRSLADLAHTLVYPELFDDLKQALQHRQSRSREVRARDGREFLASALPYGDEATPRAVVSFIDISQLRDAEDLQQVLDAQPAHVAVLDAQGVIRRVNRAWRDFGSANGAAAGAGAVGPGADYLQSCRVDDASDPTARQIARGLRGVLQGRSPGFACLYPCHSPIEQRWFLMHAAPLAGRTPGAVVSHLNVTGWLEGSRLGFLMRDDGDAGG